MLKTENNKKASNINPVKDNLREDGVSWAKASGLRKMFSSPTEKVNSSSQTDVELEKQIKNFSTLPFAEGLPADFINKKINTTSNFILVDVPADNSCLFWATALAYLISLDEDQFENGWEKLFGYQCSDLEKIKEEIKNFNSQSLQTIQNQTFFSDLIRGSFRRRVVEYMDIHRDDFLFEDEDIDGYIQKMFDPNEWGGGEEIKAISLFLQCKIHVFPSWNKGLREPAIYGAGLPILYLFYDDEKRHYYFGVLKGNFKIHEPINEAQALGSDHNNTDTETVQPIYRKSKKRNFPAAYAQQETLSIHQTLLNSLLNGIAVGICLETALLIIPASLPVRFFSQALTLNDTEFFELLTSYAASTKSTQTYQLLILSPTPLDPWLASFLDFKRLFTRGILWGATGGLVKAIWDTEKGYQILLVMTAVILSTLSTENEKIEKGQLIFRSLLLPFLSVIGFIKTIDLSLPYLTKIANGAKSVTNNFIKKAPSFSFFFARKNENSEADATNSEAYFQAYTRACH